MPEFDRWVRRYARRVNLGEFLRDAAEWLAGFCFVFGAAVLLVKLRLPNLWPWVLWLAVASVPVATAAWWWSRRRRLSSRDAVALLDQRLDAGGLLMTLSETHGPAWKDRLPQWEPLWQTAMPKFRPARFMKVLMLPIVFAVASCFVPLRNLNEPIVQGAVAQQTMQRLEELMQRLQEAEVLKQDEPESEQLRQEMQKLAAETKEKPLTHEKWETVDALQNRLRAKLERTANMVAQGSDALAGLTNALSELSKTGESNLSDEQLQQLEQQVAQALQQLANGGAIGKMPPALQAKLGQLMKGGQFRLPQDAALREALAGELQAFLDAESERLAELWQECHGEDCKECNKPGGG